MPYQFKLKQAAAGLAVGAGLACQTSSSTASQHENAES
jgi:hypothetical protein